VKLLRTEVAFHSPWMDLLAKTFDGSSDPYYTVKVPDYTSVIALTADRRVVLVRQYRQAVEHYTIELPSGVIDPGESPEETARRELLEETGYQAGVVERLGSMEPDTGRLQNRIWACMAYEVRPVEGAAPEQGMEVVLWSIEELIRATAEGRFDHALHVAIVGLASFQGKL
jgi:ADP-ribose pyrophosphatase